MPVEFFQGRRVYVDSYANTLTALLESALPEDNIVQDIYFYNRQGGRGVKTDFANTINIGDGTSGLVIRVGREAEGCGAAIAIARLEEILTFIVESKNLGKDLNELKGRAVTSFYRGAELLGVALKE